MWLKPQNKKVTVLIVIFLAITTVLLQLLREKIEERNKFVDTLTQGVRGKRIIGNEQMETTFQGLGKEGSYLGKMFEKALSCLRRSKKSIADYLANNDEYDLWSTNNSIVPLKQDTVELHPKCDQDNLLVVLLTTRPINFIHRSTIRLSWGRMDTNINRAMMGHHDDTRWQTIFTVGLTQSRPINRLVQLEHMEFQDILRLDYTDTYANLPNKTMLTLEWIADNCRAKFVLKTDDDCFVNIVEMLPWLQALPERHMYIGRVNYNMPVIRNPKHRNHVPKEDHEDEFYRPYCAGGGYILRGSIVKNVTLIGQKVKQIINEDAYIGMLTNLLGIKPINEDRFLPFIFNGPPVKKLKTCDYQGQFLVHNILGRRQLLMHWNSYVTRKFPSVCASFAV